MGPNFAQTFGKVSRQHCQKAKQTPTPLPTDPDTKLWKRATNIWALPFALAISKLWTGAFVQRRKRSKLDFSPLLHCISQLNLYLRQNNFEI